MGTKETGVLLSKEECMLALSRALRRSDFVLEKLEETTVNTASSGFMARHISLGAWVTVDGAAAPQRVNMFIKVPPSSRAHRRLLDEMNHFGKELVMYDTLIPLMADLMPRGVTQPFARCLLTRRANDLERGSDELLVMEDLKEKGYRVRDRMAPLDYEHCLAVLLSLARFHAGTLLVQRAAEREGKGDNVDYVDGKMRIADDRIISGTDREMGRRWADTSVETIAWASAGLWPERFAGEEERLAARLRESWDEISRMVRPSRKHTNVICHGDIWPNNFMFRYGDDGKLTDNVLVDLQLARFCPPATDILMLFHTTTTKGFREKHMGELVLAYHRCLEEIVGNETLDRLLPLRALQGSLEEFSFFGKLVSSVWCPICLADDEEAAVGEPVDFVTTIMRNRGDVVLRNARNRKEYRERIMDCFEECLRHIGLWK